MAFGVTPEEAQYETRRAGLADEHWGLYSWVLQVVHTNSKEAGEWRPTIKVAEIHGLSLKSAPTVRKMIARMAAAGWLTGGPKVYEVAGRLAEAQRKFFASGASGQSDRNRSARYRARRNGARNEKDFSKDLSKNLSLESAKAPASKGNPAKMQRSPDVPVRERSYERSPHGGGAPRQRDPRDASAGPQEEAATDPKLHLVQEQRAKVEAANEKRKREAVEERDFVTEMLASVEKSRGWGA